MSRLPISHKASTIAASRPAINEIRFIYNFFMPDEAGNDMSDESGGYMMSNESSREFENQKNFSTEVPRLVAVSIEPGQILGSTPDSVIKSMLENQDLDEFLMKDIDLNFPNFVGTRIGDGELIGRITKLASHLHRLKTGEESEDPSRIAETIDQVFDDEERKEAIQDCFVSSDPIVPTSGDQADGIVAPHASMKKVNFVTPLPSESEFLKSAGFSIDLKLSTNYYDSALSLGMNFPSTPLTQFVMSNFSNIKRVAANAPNVEDRIGDPYRSGGEDSLIPLSFEKVDTHERPQYANAGIILQKYEVTEKGLQHVEDNMYPVDEDTPNFTIYDPNVKYGTTYGYGLRELYMITATVNADLPDLGAGIYKTTFLIEGSPAPIKYVTCIEKRAPRPPEALFVRRGVNADGLILEWQFPSNPQRDIKKFQIFRRKNIYEPFYLLREIDFNNADPVTASAETINQELIEYVSFPKTIYQDFDFEKTDKYIYAVCSIDAHGYSSTYSAQVEVSMDVFRNVPVRKTISPAGAPKQYPNMYISSTDADNIDKIRLTEDIIRVSGYDEVEVFFDPEAQKIIAGGQTKDVYQLAKTADPSIDAEDPNPKFVLQFLNLDNGKSQNVDILIRDVRLNKV